MKEVIQCIDCFDQMWMPFMPYMTNIMRILGHTFFYRKFTTNSMSFRTGNVEYIITQKDHKCRYKKYDFHLSTPPLELFSYPTRNTISDARNILQI